MPTSQVDIRRHHNGFLLHRSRGTCLGDGELSAVRPLQVSIPTSHEEIMSTLKHVEKTVMQHAWFPWDASCTWEMQVRPWTVLARDLHVSISSSPRLAVRCGHSKRHPFALPLVRPVRTDYGSTSDARLSPPPPHVARWSITHTLIYRVHQVRWSKSCALPSELCSGPQRHTSEWISQCATAVMRHRGFHHIQMTAVLRARWVRRLPGPPTSFAPSPCESFPVVNGGL